MGCCFSTPETPKQHLNDRNGLKNQQSQLRSPVPKSHATHEVDRRAPLPVEEETVKEVLSETPISKPQVPILVEEKKPQMPIIQPQAEKFEPKGLIKKSEEVSQLSEICSMSDSFSTTTTATTATITEKREDEATSKRSGREGSLRSNQSPSTVSRKRPHSAGSSVGRERRAKSPARRVEPSPEKKSHGSSRSVRGRESSQVGFKKLNEGICEGSGRRSRSPSTKSVSGASKVSSNGRSQPKPSGGGGRQLPDKDLKNRGSNQKVGEKNDDGPRESLENPHVSFECFIFL